MRPSLIAFAASFTLIVAGCNEEAKPRPQTFRSETPRITRVLGAAAVRVPPRTTVALRAAPNGRILARVGPRTEFGSLRTMSVALVNGRWVAVRSPELGNRQLGWVRFNTIRPLRRTRRIEVDLSERTLVLTEGGVVLRREAVAIGSSETPTPPGHFFVTDKLPGPEFGLFYGCCILALSGRQPNLPQGWSGGDRLAIHGTQTPDYGEAVTNGCLHLPTEALQALMKGVPLGTPVEIRA